MGEDKKRLMWLLLLVLAMLLSTVGLTYAWMTQRASMTTLLAITPPDTITIIPIKKDGSPMTELDLDYNMENGDIKDDDGTIHIFRPVCIKSTEPIHRLEIVHTTNLGSLNFHIYPTIKTNNGFSYDSQKNLPGGYKNQGNNGLAKQEKLDNYQADDNVEGHAYPLYWIGVNCAVESEWQEGWQKVTSDTEKGADQKTYYSTYYMLEISWKDETKETDLFYIMAQNVAE